MTTADIIRFSLVLAIQAEIDGMKAENEYRKQNGDSVGYRDSHFEQKAIELRDLAACHDDQL